LGLRLGARALAPEATAWRGLWGERLGLCGERHGLWRGLWGEMLGRRWRFRRRGGGPAPGRGIGRASRPVGARVTPRRGSDDGRTLGMARCCAVGPKRRRRATPPYRSGRPAASEGGHLTERYRLRHKEGDIGPPRRSLSALWRALARSGPSWRPATLSMGGALGLGCGTCVQGAFSASVFASTRFSWSPFASGLFSRRAFTSRRCSPRGARAPALGPGVGFTPTAACRRHPGGRENRHGRPPQSILRPRRNRRWCRRPHLCRHHRRGRKDWQGRPQLAGLADGPELARASGGPGGEARCPPLLTRTCTLPVGGHLSVAPAGVSRREGSRGADASGRRRNTSPLSASSRRRSRAAASREPRPMRARPVARPCRGHRPFS
jgi:hypothetical protein